MIGFGLRSGDPYSFGERGQEWVTPGGKPPAGVTVVNNIALPEGASVAKALQEISYWLTVAKQQGFYGVLPGS